MTKRKAKSLTKKSRKGLYEKICNICGESCFVYIIYQNAPLCSDCMPVSELKKVNKIIPSETKMIDNLLKFTKKNK